MNQLAISITKQINRCELLTNQQHPFLNNNSFYRYRLRVNLHLDHTRTISLQVVTIPSLMSPNNKMVNHLHHVRKHHKSVLANREAYQQNLDETVIEGTSSKTIMMCYLMALFKLITMKVLNKKKLLEHRRWPIRLENAEIYRWRRKYKVKALDYLFSQNHVYKTQAIIWLPSLKSS